jgi:hypothetical protein
VKKGGRECIPSSNCINDIDSKSLEEVQSIVRENTAALATARDTNSVDLKG